MFMFVGLGNPGSKYTLTRHNVGFLCIDHFLRGFPGTAEKTESKALTAKVRLGTQPIITVKPQTFMNLSGQSVQPLANYYKVELEQLVVIHDEIDLPFGKIKLQRARGHGGHNGIRDIHQKLGSNDYLRLRLGVGRSKNPHISTADHVLQNFDEDEMNQMSDFLNAAGDTLCDIVELGFQKAATRINSNKEN